MEGAWRGCFHRPRAAPRRNDAVFDSALLVCTGGARRNQPDFEAEACSTSLRCFDTAVLPGRAQKAVGGGERAAGATWPPLRTSRLGPVAKQPGLSQHHASATRRLLPGGSPIRAISLPTAWKKPTAVVRSLTGSVFTSVA